ncbi:Putative HtrA2 peptidase (Serine/cysteine peptidase, trypsin-like). Similar to the N-terminus of MamE (no CXXCH and no PDZ domains) [Desulfamplus magnetovallimortis]|uniref:Magnetosome protein n=2 Tax=Desulfamplus magnetovallimortis TaxID=1246637 RepID=G8IQU1_9BACT|nr:trypsin-like peptidase domain-containing protein [Desulfamplus magnetovallimortis]AET24914.1 magnetosome protein [Desulfamplus magnetovallimortis BW-1]CCO06680.1 Putative HtrA2 peptidase (Serine/cysteine peptidase, trypsin-like). Similar to the N-terminus of MamE (no CXXCH and no PDZ domains) [Desulfamplus magnetovallimortis BW-1]SLM32731.1 Putative HtrA2 peptidase (Serine/cysteine peptidase, trypsin-like). Similar to the N-terminus of MamE (no CXXCH and no PDZ domains) [Desulfamplus magnetov
MKRNRQFKIKRLIWPTTILGIFIAGAIFVNFRFMTDDPGESTNHPEAAGTFIPGNAATQMPVQTPYTGMPQIQGNGGYPGASPTTALMIQESISHVVSLIRPSVVAVSRKNRTKVPPEPQGGLSYLNPFSANFMSEGSGVIINPEGYVLTTFQTVGTDSTVDIKIFSGTDRTCQADVIAVDSQTDLAVLKIRDHGSYPAVVLGNSDLLEVGDIVFAIGSPFGFSQTVTMGIVSSHNRNLNINGIRYPDMIQTDAAINQGNDGGPLVNVKGEVVGINMATFMPGNQYAGIGFAIPINDILAFVNSNLPR